jgi:hypothetical protein
MDLDYNPNIKYVGNWHLESRKFRVQKLAKDYIYNVLCKVVILPYKQHKCIV